MRFVQRYFTDGELAVFRQYRLTGRFAACHFLAVGIPEDMAEAVEDAFRYGKLVLATITYNGDIFPFMRTFIEHLKERNYQNRTIGLIENGSWASTAGKVIAGMLEKSKNITMLEKPVKIMSSLSEENLKELDEMAEELMK